MKCRETHRGGNALLYEGHKYIELTSQELISWKVDLVGVDLMGVDLVGVDLVGVDPVGGHHYSALYSTLYSLSTNSVSLVTFRLQAHKMLSFS